MHKDHRNNWETVFPILLLSTLGVLVYSNTFFNSFHFDDLSFIVNNPTIRSLGNIEAIFSYWPARCVGFLSFALNYYFHQLQVSGYHMVNIALHICAAMLVFWLMNLTLSVPLAKDQKLAKGRRVISLCAALIFLVHPIQTETLNYVFQRVTILATIFYLASLCFYIKSVAINKDARSKRRDYILSLLIAFVGMFTKEIIVTFPLTLVVYDLLFLKVEKRWNWRRVLPFFILFACLPLFEFFTGPLIASCFNSVLRNLKDTSGIYLLTQFRVILTYIRLVVFPFCQNIEYDYYPSHSLWEFSTLFSFLSLVALLISAIRLSSRYRLLSFGVFWFFITLLPESSILALLNRIFEHRLYLPMVGFSIFAAVLIYYLAHKRRAVLISILAILITLYSTLSYMRNIVWRDDLTLWSDAISKSPHKLRPYNERGLFYLERGMFDESIADFSLALQINPYYLDGYCNRAHAYELKKEYQSAFTDYDKALTVNPNYTKAYINRGTLYYVLKDNAKAIADYQRAVSIDSGDAMAFTDLAIVYSAVERKEDAVVNLRKALKIDPGYLLAYQTLVRLYQALGKGEEIHALYKMAIDNQVEYFDAYYNMAQVYSQAGREAEAIALYNKAVALNPYSAEAYSNLGALYCGIGRNSMAVAVLQKALALNPRLGIAHNDIAVAYFLEKNYQLAIMHCDEAVVLGYPVAQKLLDWLKPYRIQK